MYIPLLTVLVGLLMYALAANPRVIEIGRLMFACGLLVFLLTFNTDAVNLLRR